MDLGLFLPSANNGWIISRNAPQYVPTFALNRDVACQAERLGFDFVLSMVKHRGYGGATHHWDYSLDSLTLMAGLAPLTSRIKLIGSVHPLTLHPAMAARMAMTIDQISQGRFGLNVVAGWNKYEFSQMGLWPGDQFYRDRYDYAGEWTHALKALWQSGRASFHGEYFHLDDCYCKTGPVQPNLPPIVCAGTSDRGLRFTVEEGDISFVGGSLDQIRTLAHKGKALAAALGKQIKTYTEFTLIMAETDEKAQALWQFYVDGADADALTQFLGAAGNDAHGTTAQNLLKDLFIVPPLVGSPETIARQLAVAAESVDGVLLTFPDFHQGLDLFGREVLPRLIDYGVRLPFEHIAAS
ncbi:MAG: LLM class flavin-dependent oxidoreductase [Firmicutes bacterium]|nr:LLM class flavin-dependent oxidoreductase [Bacillota bacterium]